MDKYKCKHCDRTFRNGKALGGHLKIHSATHPLPPTTTQHQLGDRTDQSASSSSSSSSGEEKEEEKSLAYGLEENSKKSLRSADLEFSSAVDSGSVVQEKESESESRNLTRRRSTRNRTVGSITNAPPSLVKSHTEPGRVSPVYETMTEEEVAALTLMRLNRDALKGKNVEQEGKNVEQESVELLEESEKMELNEKKIPGKHRCEKCKKSFRSLDTLDEHKRVCCEPKNAGKVADDSKIFQCPFCSRVFASAQALGSHKRIHVLPAASSPNTAAAASSSNTAAAANSTRIDNNLIDLNSPAPMEEDEFSVVSDA